MKLKTLQPRIGTLNTDIGTSRRLRAPDAAARQAVYSSRRWRERVRPAKLARDPLCQRCMYLGLTVRAEHVDHWQPLAQAGDAWSDTNLISLCHPCHSVKTACEKNGSPFPEVAPSAPRTAGIA
jgi:5-methylcytosine-specific restriction endonuclease McrA